MTATKTLLLSIRAGITGLNVFTHPSRCVRILEITFFIFNRIFINVTYPWCKRLEELNSDYKEIILQTQSTSSQYICIHFIWDSLGKCYVEIPLFLLSLILPYLLRTSIYMMAQLLNVHFS